MIRWGMALAGAAAALTVAFVLGWLSGPDDDWDADEPWYA